MTGTEKACGTRPPVPRTWPPQRSRPGLHSQPGSMQTPNLAQISSPQPLGPLTPNIQTPNIEGQICRSSVLNSSFKSRPPSPPNPTPMRTPSPDIHTPSPDPQPQTALHPQYPVSWLRAPRSQISSPQPCSLHPRLSPLSPDPPSRLAASVRSYGAVYRALHTPRAPVLGPLPRGRTSSPRPLPPPGSPTQPHPPPPPGRRPHPPPRPQLGEPSSLGSTSRGQAPAPGRNPRPPSPPLCRPRRSLTFRGLRIRTGPGRRV